MLIGAGVRSGGSPGRFFGAPLAAVVERNANAKAGAGRNWWAGQATVVSGASIANKSSVPDGLRHPASWLMAPKAGGMSSRNWTDLTLTASGAGAMGINIIATATVAILVPDAVIWPLDDTPPARTATASLSITTNQPTGGLIVSGAGSAGFTLTTNEPLLTASLNGEGAATMALAGGLTTLTAEGSLIATAALAIAAAADILPTDDSPVLREGSATLALSASLTAYALGNMIGTTDVAAVVTNDSVAAAVWSVSAAAFNDPGTTGAKLNSASAAGDPWTAELPGAYPAGSAGELLGTLVAGLTPEQTTQLLELWRLAGLDAAAPLEVMQTHRSAGRGLSQAISDAGDGTVTVQRL